MWLRNTGGNKYSLKRTPTIDTTTHTPNGWYAMVPAEYLKTTYYATIHSPPLHGRSDYNCFSMNYWAVGNSTNTPALTVTFSDLTNYGRTIASVQLNTSTISMWQPFHYRVPKIPARYSISIGTSYHAQNLNSDIAIDDIKLSTHACAHDKPPTTPLPTPVPQTEHKWDCNFEYPCPQWSFDSNWLVTSYRKGKCHF